MTFGQMIIALITLKEGTVISRESWLMNGRVMFAITKKRINNEDRIVRCDPEMKFVKDTGLPKGRKDKGRLMANDWFIVE